MEQENQNSHAEPQILVPEKGKLLRLNQPTSVISVKKMCSMPIWVEGLNSFVLTFIYIYLNLSSIPFWECKKKREGLRIACRCLINLTLPSSQAQSAPNYLQVLQPGCGWSLAQHRGSQASSVGVQRCTYTALLLLLVLEQFSLSQRAQRQS